MIGIVILIVVLVAVVALSVGSTVVLRRRGYSGVGGNTIVRCSKGHLFTSIWLPGGSLKAIRLGWYRYQRCPVGHHWALVAPVKVSELTEEQKEEAAKHHDAPVP